MALIAGVVATVFTGVIDFTTYSWLPLHMGSSIKPLDMDNSIVSIMSHNLGFYPVTSQGYWTLHALFWGLMDGAISGLVVGLSCGGAAYVEHFVLRFLLWCARCVPFNYPHFLDYATECMLLRKVGGGYIFMHRFLLEYFVKIETVATLSVQASL